MKSNISIVRIGLLSLLAPFVLWIGLLVVLPHVELIRYSFLSHREGSFTFSNYTNFFTNRLYINTYLRSALFSILVTIITFALGFPLAFFITKVAGRKSSAILMLLVILPFWISELIQAFAWMVMMRETGIISYFLQAIGLADHNLELLYNDAAIGVGLVYTSVLFMVVPIVSTLSTMDDSIIEAAYDLGSSFWNLIFEVIIPYAAPGIATGSIMVFMLTLGNYISVTLLGGKNSLWFTEQIYNQFVLRFNWNQGAAFGILLLILSSLLVWIGLKITGQEMTEVLK